MRYGYVVNGEIVEGPKALPKSWKNISNFHNTSEGDLAGLGWLPWRLVEGEGDFYIGTQVEIKSNEIVETKQFREKTEAEILSDEKRRLEDVAARRRADYELEADGLFFKYQRGEATEADWLEKIEEIKVRHLK